MINEEKSISEIVMQSGDRLYNLILADLGNRSEEDNIEVFSDANGQTYVKGDIQYPVNDIAPEVGMLNVEYYVYIYTNTRDYLMNCERKLDENSELDYENRFMRVIGIWVGEDMTKTFKSIIYHELTHLYQYSRGMEKRKTLYEKCVEFIRSEDQVKKRVGELTYYSFPHEQDAMVHQFYSQLMSLNPNETFEFSLRNISMYKEVLESLDFIKSHANEIAPYVKELGMTMKQWRQRIHFANKRFVNKFRNAYDKYRIDRNKFSRNESFDRLHGFYEANQLHKNLKHGLESFYTEYTLSNEGLFTKYLD